MLFPNVAISTPSLGQHSSHSLDEKIKYAAKHGFNGIEIVFGDLEIYAESRRQIMLQGAEEIRELCQQLNVTILSLAPFENFEASNIPLSQRLEKAKVWIEVARTLGAIYLQVPAQYDEKCRENKSAIVSDLQQLADLASSTEPKIAIAYEPMSWSVHNSTWEDALDTVTAVDRENFGLCLDNFHIITKLWASPSNPQENSRMQIGIWRYLSTVSEHCSRLTNCSMSSCLMENSSTRHFPRTIHGIWKEKHPSSHGQGMRGHSL